jgi:RNA:NAD 2'-phosphotransferase (TPT1/KptA family)
MILEKENTRLSKLLSYILRHKPEAYQIVLDENATQIFMNSSINQRHEKTSTWPLHLSFTFHD